RDQEKHKKGRTKDLSKTHHEFLRCLRMPRSCEMKLAQRGIEVKGTFFQKPLEFRLSVDGETWRQGDPITGTLTVKNHSPEPLPTQEITVRLARATLRKVHQKLEGAFGTAVGSAAPPSDASTLAPGAEFNFPWKFVTDRNCPITDSVSSLF